MSFTFFLFSFLLCFGSLAQKSENPENLRFKQGERLEYRLSYGWFTVGYGEMIVDAEDHIYNDKDSYKFEIFGRTAGLVGIFTDVNDNWGAYLNKQTMLPEHAFANIQEGKYTRNERIFFDQSTGDIRVEMTKKGRIRPTKNYNYGTEIHDLISGYMYLRNYDFSEVPVGDTVQFNAFYDEIFYDFRIILDAVEDIDSDVGDLKAYRLIPLFPENDIFPGEHPITFWVSADQNQLPLRVEARMFFGKAYGDLINYKNIKYGPDFRVD